MPAVTTSRVSSVSDEAKAFAVMLALSFAMGTVFGMVFLVTALGWLWNT